MINVAIDERTQELLNDPLLGERDVDVKIQQLIESECLHQGALSTDCSGIDPKIWHEP